MAPPASSAPRYARAPNAVSARLQLADELAALARAVAERIGDDELVALLEAGREFDPQGAVAWARRGPASGWSSLTPAEHTVVEHVVAGRTNGPIAERMFITRGTVKNHLAHIYAKLKVNNGSHWPPTRSERRRDRRAVPLGYCWMADVVAWAWV